MALTTLSNPLTTGAHARPLPHEIEEITPQWLTAALSVQQPGSVVEEAEVLDVRRGFTTVLRLRLALNETARRAGVPEVVMLKGGFEPHSRARARTYVMEAIGYRDLAHLGLSRPAVYYVEAEPERQQAIIIMEDLTRRGVKFYDGLKPNSFQQLQRSLVELARFHAKTWNSPDLLAGGPYDAIPLNSPSQVHRYMHTRNLYSDAEWNELITRPQGAAVSVEFHDREHHSEGLLYLAKLGEELPMCIVHGDTHLGNIYENADGSTGFYDAIPRREPAYHELAYTITCGLDPARRREWERLLVRGYIEELGRNGVDIDFDETMYYYALYLHLGYSYFLMNDPYFQTVSFNTAHLVRFSTAMMDHGAKQLLKGAIGARKAAEAPKRDVTPTDPYLA